MKHKKFWKYFLFALLSSTALSGGGVGVYLYLKLKPLENDNIDVGDKGSDTNDLPLQTKWDNFIEKVKENDYNLLQSINKDRTKLVKLWEEAIKEIRTKLEYHWKKVGLKNIENNLVIKLYYKNSNLTGVIKKDDLNKLTNITVHLFYKSDSDKKYEIIHDIKLENYYWQISEWFRFVHKFINKNLLKDIISNEEFDNKTPWKEVVNKIKVELQAKYLSIRRSNLLYDLGDNLKIEIEISEQSEKTKKITDYDSEIGAAYFSPNDIFVNVIHKYFDIDGQKFLVDKFQFSEKVIWEAFINLISQDNKLNDLSLIDFTNKDKWGDVLKAIRKKLAIKFKEIFNNDSDLNIALQDEKGQPLDLENEIGLDYLKDNKEIKIVLSYGKNKSLKNTFDIDFKVIESPLTKFIKSLEKKKQLGSFYDLDGWAKLEAEIKKLIDKSEFKDLITFDPIDKEAKWEAKDDNQTIDVKFKWKDYTSDAIKFNFKVIESPLTKFIKSLEKKKQLGSFYDLDGWAKLEAEIQELIDNNPAFKDITIDKIDKNKDWKVGNNQTIDVKFKWKDYTSDAIKFNFKVIESPLTKFIKSLEKKKQLGSFYDLDGWAKLEAEIQELIDNNPAFKDITIDKIDKNKDWKVGNNQTIDVKFKWKDYTSDAIKFNFKVIESPLTKFIKSLEKKKQLGSFYDLDGWAKLEAEIQELIDNNPAFKDITIDKIDKNKDWKVGNNQTIDVKFKWKDYTSDAIKFNFKVIESPLTKFIKSLEKKKQLQDDFYDLDGWAKLEAEIQELIDNNPKFKNLITFDPIDKKAKWEAKDGNQTINVKFKQNDREVKRDFTFDFKVIESPLTKFIKSLEKKKQLGSFYDLDGWAKLEAEIQELIDNNPAFKDITIDKIDKNKDWKVGNNQTIDVKFKWKDYTSDAIKFNFKVIESPLTKFIKSLEKKKQLQDDFYDLDGWAKLEAEIQELIDNNPAFKDITIDKIDKNKDWKVGNNQTIDVKFKWKDYTSDAIKFNFKVIESPLTKFIKSLEKKKQLQDDFYDLDGWAKLEAEIQELIDNNPKFKNLITFDPIDKKAKWEAKDGNQTINVKFKQNDREVKRDFTFDFKVIESPLTKFIKSLEKKKQLGSFYDLDGWAKLEAEIKKLIDKSEFKDLITFDPIDKEAKWEAKDDNQTIDVKFKWKDYTSDAIKFNFKVIESPLTKFIKSLEKKKQLGSFYDLDGWAKLEAEIQELIDNNPAFKDITIDKIDKNKDWKVGNNQTIDVKFKWKDYTSDAIKFNFKVIESPLTKFIKSLEKKKQLGSFYDLDGWAKVAAKIQELIDNNPEFKDITIDKIDKNKDWKVGNNQTIDVKFKWKDYTSDAIKFNFKVIESPLTKFIKSLEKKKQLGSFYDLDGWAKLEAEIQELIDNNPAFKDITIDKIDKNKDWKVGNNQTIDVKFKWKDYTSDAIKFNFKVIESPLTKFIKSLEKKKQLQDDFYDLDGWAKLEAEIQELIDNNPKFKNLITFDPIDKKAKWEAKDGNQTINVKFKQNDREVKRDFTFDFKVIESPLTKFIKSLEKKKQLGSFYDLDGWAKLEAEIKKLIDKSEFKDLITFDPIDKEAKWEAKDDNQTIDVKFKWKDYTSDAIKFNFKVIESPLTKFIKSLEKKKQLGSFYDLDGWAKLEAEIQELIDNNPAFKDITIDKIDKNKDWKVGNNQTIDVKFKWKDYTSDAIKFNFKVIESPLTKFIKSLEKKKQLGSFYDLDGWAKVAAKIQELIDNNPEFKDITIDKIDKNKDWKVGNNQTIDVKFKWKDYTSDAIKFNFKVIESPLTKFIKSLEKKKQLGSFYDLDGWAKLEAEIQELIDNNPAFKDITIDKIDKNKDWKVGNNQTIDVKFKWKDYTSDAIKFNFKVIESPLTKFIKSLEKKKQLQDDFYDLDGWAKLEAEIQELIDNNPKFKNLITFDPIDKKAKWEAKDGNQTINVKFKQNDREVKRDFTFDFKVIESPLTKFIKSLEKKKQLGSFYDLDGWAKLEVKIQELIDNNPEFKDITIDKIDKNKDWKVGNNQTIDVKFKWKDYTSDAIKFKFKVVKSPKTIVQEFITSLDKNLGQFNDQDTYAVLISKLEKRLNDGIKLEIVGADKDDKLVVNDEHKIKFKFKLGDYTSQEIEFKFKVVKSNKTKWLSFIGSISGGGKLNDLSLTNFTNKNKWDDVLKAIREKLVKEFNKVFDNKTDLLVELLDLSKQKLVLGNQICQKGYFPKWNIKVKLTHNKLGDKNSRTLDLVISTPLDINELKSIVNTLLINIINNNETMFKDNFIKELNKPDSKYKDYNFQTNDFKFDFKPAKEGDNKVSVTIINNNKNKIKGNQVEGSYAHYRELMVSLVELEKEIADLIWKDKTSSLKSFKNLIKNLLKTKHEKYNINIDQELEIKFEPPKFGKKGSWSIGIIPNSPNVKNKIEKQIIKVYDSWLFDLSDSKYGINKLINDLLAKIANNDEKTFVEAFIDKLNKIEGFFKNKFEKTDFKFDFKPAEKGDNKVSVTITSNNEDKVKGEVKGSAKDYDELKLKLNELTDEIKELIKKNEPKSNEHFNELIKNLLNTKYKHYKINIDQEVDIKFELPKFGKKGNFKIKSKKSSSNTIGEVWAKGIAVYKSLLLDLDQLKDIVKKLLQDSSNNDATKFKNKFLDEINKIDKFKNKFNINDFENDFYFNFEPATKKENLLKVTITARNYDKVIGQIKESHLYDEYKIHLNDLIKDIKNLINEKQVDNLEDLNKLLKHYFDSKYKDYEVNIENDITIEFTPPKLGDPTPGRLIINSNNDKKFKNRLDIYIPYYDRYKIDFNQFKNLLEDKIENKKPNDLNDLKNIIKDLLKQDFNRYANQNKITINDLDIDFNLEKPIKKDSKLKITISLKEDSKFKTKNEFKFTLSSTPAILDQWNKFSNELKEDNAWASLKQLLEKDKKYKSWDQVVKIIKEWLEAKYAKKYNQIFKDTKLKISLWQDGNNNTLTGIIEPKKEIDITVLIDLEKEGFFSFTTWYIPLSFKMNLNALLDEYANKIEKESVGNITYKLDYEDNPHFFIQDLKEKIKAFFEKNKFYNKTIDYKFLDEANLKFIAGTNNISINLTYLGIDKEVKLKLVNKKLDLSKYKNIGLIEFFVDPNYDESAFGVIYIKDEHIIRKFVEKIKKDIPEFKNIDVDRYVKYFKLKSDYPITAHNTKERIYTLDFICSLTNVEGKFENVKIDVRKQTIHLEKLALKFLSEQLRNNKELFELNQIVDYKFHFDENGYKHFEKIEEQYRDMISNKLDSILKDEKLWFAKILASKNLRNDFGFYNFNFKSFRNFNFWENELRMMIGYSYPDVLNKDNDFKSEGIEFTNPLKIDIISGLIPGDVDPFFRKVDKKKRKFNYSTKEGTNSHWKTVEGLMTTDLNNWMDVKKFIDDEIFKNITLDRENIHYDHNLSSSKNGYFYYVKNINAVVNVFVDSYNNDGSYRKTPSNTFYSGKITIKVGYINHFNEKTRTSIYDNWTWVTKEYNLVNKIEHEWWGQFKNKLDNESNKSNHWRFTRTRTLGDIADYIYKTNIILNGFTWEANIYTKNSRTHYIEGDWINFHFVLRRKNTDLSQKGQLLYYTLKLGGTGDINRIMSDRGRRREIWMIFKDFNWRKLDLKFVLHRNSMIGDVPLSLGKDEKYIIDLY